MGTAAAAAAAAAAATAQFEKAKSTTKVQQFHEYSINFESDYCNKNETENRK